MSTGKEIAARVAAEFGGVKPWGDRAAEVPDGAIVTSLHISSFMQAENARLRSALVGLIGADSEQELRQMEATMRLLPAPEEDKAVSINAIHALLATLPVNAEVRGA